MYKIAIAGTGNVAFHLAKKLNQNGHALSIISRSKENGTRFLENLGTTLPLIYSSTQAFSSFDFVVLAVPDKEIKNVLAKYSFADGILLHVSGAQPMQLLAAHNLPYGVLYPFQTFSKKKDVDFTSIPILIEGSDKSSLGIIQKLALELSPKVFPLSSEDRLKIHLAAVFACNFSNHLYTITEQLIEDSPLQLHDFSHLINETVEKAMELGPAKAQTGPAIRGDQGVMEKHLELLDDPTLKALYQLHSQMIGKSREHLDEE